MQRNADILDGLVTNLFTATLGQFEFFGIAGEVSGLHPVPADVGEAEMSFLVILLHYDDGRERDVAEAISFFFGLSSFHKHLK